MTAILFTLTFLASVSFAGEVRREYDEGTERQCFLELKALGCVNGQTESPTCAETQKSKLSRACQGLLNTKRNPRLQGPEEG